MNRTLRIVRVAALVTLFSAVIAGGAAVCAAIPVGGEMLLVDRSSASLALVFDNRRLAPVEIGDAAGRQETGLGRSIPLERLGVL